MATGTSVKDRCRLCYTRLKDATTSHHKTWCTRDHHRIFNIYKRRPYRYRDLIVRYLYIHLPENENHSLDQYSHLVCGTCATSLNKLDQTFRTFQQTQKLLRSKFRKTSQIVNYQLDKQRVHSSIKSTNDHSSQASSTDEIGKEHTEKHPLPKRQSKRKGEPKHIDQTMNHQPKKPLTNGVQLIVKVPSNTSNPDGLIDTSKTGLSSNTRTSPRRKALLLINDSESGSLKKKFKRLLNEPDPNKNDSSNCVNLLKPSVLTDSSINNNNNSFPLNLSTLTGSFPTPNNRSSNTVKGNHIERIAVSLLSGSDGHSDIGNSTSSLSNGNDDHHPVKTRMNRKAPSLLDVTTTNNILSPIVRSPSLVDEPDDDRVSLGGASNDSSGTSRSIEPNTATNIPNVNKNLSSMISTTPTAEGLTITAINPTGQKQVFMAKQLGNLKKYQCGLCEKIVTNIQIHVRRHTNDKPYPCTYCEKRFTNSGDLQIHVRIHTGEKPYACPLCLKSYRTIGNFNSHVKTHDSGIRPHRCELCNQIFPIPKDWYSHLRSSHRSRTLNSETSNPVSSTSSLSSSKTTTTVTKPLFSNSLCSQQQHSEAFIPNKVKLEPINRSQLIIKSSTENDSTNGDEDENEDDDQKPVNMSKKEDFNDEDEEQEDEDDEENLEENHRQSTRNLLSNVTSPVHA